MRVYKAESVFVVGIDGGSFEGLSQQSEAIILQECPVPTKMWQTPTEVRENYFKQDLWEYDYTFREFQTGNEKFYISKIDKRRLTPGYISGTYEFFVTEEFVREKIESLRKRNSLAEYHWDDIVGTWNEVEKLFCDEYDFEDETDEN